MQTKTINWSIICYDEYNLNKHPELKDFLDEVNLKSFLDNIWTELILVLGGDWTMLKAIQGNHKENIPFLWINFWNKGFLLNNKGYIGKWNKPLISREYPLLDIKEWEKLRWVALNEVNIYSPEWKLVHIKISLSNKQKLKLKWDWIIVSTPIGSTGHNKSYSGHILPHTSPNIVITSKWTLNPDSSKIIEWDTSIFIENLWRKNIIWINTDWNTLFSWEDISIEISKSKNSIRFLIFEDYISIWDNKVLEEQWFNL